MSAVDVIKGFGTRLFGSRNERVLKGYRKTVAAIGAREEALVSLSDQALQNAWADLKTRWQEPVSDAYLIEGFAIIRESAKRALGLRPFDVQLMGGLALHQGKIAEMATGEGKTLSATLPACLNALSGRGVHVVTVNPYLASRDADWMRPLYDFLGLSVGVIVPDMSTQDRQEAYACDIVYATNNELGFDYLRDNMAIDASERVQRGLYFIIIDEVDSILIDEARTPLIISGPVEEDTDLFLQMDALARGMQGEVMLPSKPGEEVEPSGDFIIDEKDRQIHLTEKGHEHAEQVLRELGLVQAGESLYDVQHVRLLYYLAAALRARHCFVKDVAYIVQNDQVVIVDEHTGRSMSGRRWGDGLHQAMEAKEGLPIQADHQTLASITFQNFFRQYERISGMTGTADTEAYEFQQIYGLEVVALPTHLPMVRIDYSDQVFVTKQERYAAIVDDIKKRHATGQPILVGTASIASSEHLSALLQKAGIEHHVLNAKHHSKEADIIAQAGCLKAVTIATNMAGRGTDIVLGGSRRDEADWQQQHDAVLALGGLYVIGAERHESRRIDNQLRGRAGRQGDPGASQFFLSLEDDLMRIFAGDWVRNLMRRMGMKEGEPLSHPMLTRTVEGAQRKVEGHHFDIRKQLLQFDDIANDQRHLVYAERRLLLDAEDLSGHIQTILSALARDWVQHFMPEQQAVETWDSEGLFQVLHYDCGVPIDHDAWQQLLNGDGDLESEVLALLQARYQTQKARLGESVFPKVARFVILQHLDMAWRSHLVNMDHLRQGIHLRGYAQKDPIQEYKKEAFALFNGFLKQVKHTSMAALLTVELNEKGQEPGGLMPSQPEASVPPSRNSNCPCGSGLKYKHCHGKIS